MTQIQKAMVNSENKNLTDIETQCPECNKVTEFSVPTQEWANYVMGQSIQIAMPSVDADHREMLLTGFCSVCWDAMFGMDDFEEEFEVPD